MATASDNSNVGNTSSSFSTAAKPASSNTALALRPIIIDGSNVAMQFTKGQYFETRAILICARYFIVRGHQIEIYLPKFRQNQREDMFRYHMKNQYLLHWLEDRDLLFYTPCRRIKLGENQYRRVMSYDDFIIVEKAHERGAVIVSQDQYRDVADEHPEWLDTINNRQCGYMWKRDEFIVPWDPMGKRGPRLDDFLRYRPEERVFLDDHIWTDEYKARLLKEIDEILAAPPPPARGERDDEQTGLTHEEVEAQLPNLRHGFIRRGFFSANHRNRRGVPHMDEIRRMALSTASDANLNPIEGASSGGASGTDANFADNTDGDPVDPEGNFEMVASGGLQNEVPVGELIAIDDDGDWLQNFSSRPDDVPAPSQASTSSTSVMPNAEPENATGSTQDDFRDQFYQVFPRQTVNAVFEKFPNIRNMEIFSNLLVDALLNESQ